MDSDLGAAVLHTDPFEFFRLRLGRRSTEQVIAMRWTGDPGDVLDRLFVFGPNAQPIIE